MVHEHISGIFSLNLLIGESKSIQEKLAKRLMLKPNFDGRRCINEWIE